jgi:two-component system phosphate regulon sensor histidine kinase PhoR
MIEGKTYKELQEELDEIRFQLQEANELIHAIRTGQVDALVINEGEGHQLYTLKSADHTYRVFIERMKEGAVTLSREGTILYCNTQFAKLVGLPLSKVLGLGFENFIPEEFKSHYHILLEKGWQSDSKGEMHIQDVKGQSLPVLLTCSSLELDEGNTLSILVTNLSAQKESEKELKRKNEELEEARIKAAAMNEELEMKVRERTKDLLLSREHFKFLADNIPVIVWTSSPDGKGNYFNKRWEEYTGYSAAESIMHAKEIIHPDDYDINVTKWRDAVNRKAVYESELRFRNTAGQYRWHHSHAIPFMDEDGNVVAWLGTHIDIEDQKREMDKKDEFIGVASHELKTPLTSLKGYIQLIEQQKNLPADVENYIRKANESITKLQHLINDLLDVSKIQAGKLQFSMEPLDLNALLLSTIENRQHIYKSYRILKNIDPDLRVKGNAERLEQVLMNLINNAVKYSPDHKEITIEATKQNGLVTVSVVDGGVGLTEANQKRIFERFYRVEDQRFNTSGLGMGLYIASQIVHEHNGKMHVKSTPGDGSTFSFTLPLLQ